MAVVEDDADVRGLIRMIFRKAPEFGVADEIESAEEALEKLKGTHEMGLIVLDHGLTGELTGIEAAPLFKVILPQVKIILFTTDPNLKDRAASEPAIDAFLLKTNVRQLLPTARRLCGFESPSE